MDSYRDKCFIQEFKGFEIVGEPSIKSKSDLSNTQSNIYGYSDIVKNSNKIFPSAILVGKYAIRNKSDLLLNSNNNNISPIYLSDSQYIKINDSRSK